MSSDNFIEGTTYIHDFIEECLNRNVSLEDALKAVQEEWILQLEEQLIRVKAKVRHPRVTVYK